jgi:putative hemolysin
MDLLKKLRGAAPEPELSLGRLHLLLSQAVVQQLIGPDEGHMLQRILSLAERPLSAVMIPKSAVVAVPAGASITEIIERYQACGFSRIPVYEDSADNIIGIIHL